MNFNSFDYFFFFSIVYLLYRSVFGTHKYQNLFLLLASLFFYSWWSPIHVLLLIYSGFSDYYIALGIQNNEDKKIRSRYLTLSIINNLTLLLTFKYLSPACETINIWLSYTPLSFRILDPDLVLPIGISFYTFQTLSYAFDVHRKHVPPLKSKIDFMLYVSFFPQLIAGPILRAKQFVPQLNQKFQFSETLFFSGVFLILWGLMKKVCIADPVGVYFVDPVYTDATHRSSLEILLATYAYGFQVYNDFSGYSDMAIGSALILGFKIPINFDSPFLCINSKDFWNRWHISLSHWVRDYVFYPFHSKQFFKTRVRLNLFITMVLIGVWHGARWTYLFFGLFHGLLSIIHSKYGKHLPKVKGPLKPLWLFCCWLVFWHMLSIGFWLFRADDLNQAFIIAKDFFQFNSFEINFNAPISTAILCIFLALSTHLLRAQTLQNWSEAFSKLNIFGKLCTVWTFLLLLIHFEYMIQGQQAFIYFQF